MVDTKIYDYFTNVYGYNRGVLANYKIHEEMGTHIVLEDEDGVYAYARWTVTGNIANIYDMFIEKGGVKTIRLLARELKRRFPDVEYLRYGRGLKNKKYMRTLPINKFTGRI